MVEGSDNANFMIVAEGGATFTVEYEYIKAPKCEQVKTLGDSLAIDGSTQSQNFIVKSIVRFVKPYASKKEKVELAKLQKLSSELSVKNWSAAWSISSTINVCEASPLCVSVASVSGLDEALNRSKELLVAAQKAATVVSSKKLPRSVRKKVAAYLLKAASTNEKIASLFKAIPPNSQCSS